MFRSSEETLLTKEVARLLYSIQICAVEKRHISTNQKCYRVTTLLRGLTEAAVIVFVGE